MTSGPTSLTDLGARLLAESADAAGRAERTVHTAAGGGLRQVLVAAPADRVLGDVGADEALFVVVGGVRVESAQSSWHLSAGDHLAPSGGARLTALEDAVVLLTSGPRTVDTGHAEEPATDPGAGRAPWTR